MGEAIGGSLGNAVGVAISPIPVIALVLMLMSRAALRNSFAFLVGWLAGLAAIGVVVLAIGLEADGGGESDGGGVLKLVIGALLLVLACRQWRGRPRAGDSPPMPAWMEGIDDLPTWKATGLGLLLTIPNPKNLGLTVAGVASIGASGLDTGQEATATAVFVAIASITIVAPVIVAVVAGARAEPALTSLRDWLVANNATVMTVLFVVLGAKVLGDGISIMS